jgi:hypothetical protein
MFTHQRHVASHAAKLRAARERGLHARTPRRSEEVRRRRRIGLIILHARVGAQAGRHGDSVSGGGYLRAKSAVVGKQRVCGGRRGGSGDTGGRGEGGQGVEGMRRRRLVVKLGGALAPPRASPRGSLLPLTVPGQWPPAAGGDTCRPFLFIPSSAKHRNVLSDLTLPTVML